MGAYLFGPLDGSGCASEIVSGGIDPVDFEELPN